MKEFIEVQMIVEGFCKLLDNDNILYTKSKNSHCFCFIWFDSSYFMRIIYNDDVDLYHVKLVNRFLDSEDKIKPFWVEVGNKESIDEMNKKIFYFYETIMRKHLIN